MRKHWSVDLFCLILGHGIILAYGNQSRQGEVGARVSRAESLRSSTVGPWGESQETRANEIARASVLAFHDDKVPLEPGGPRRFPPVSRQGHHRLRAMAGLFKLFSGYGAEAFDRLLTGSHQRGGQL